MKAKRLENLFCRVAHIKCKTPVTPEWRPYSVPTAFKKLQNAEVHAVQTPANAVETLSNRLERHPAAFTLSMLKTNPVVGVSTAC